MHIQAAPHQPYPSVRLFRYGDTGLDNISDCAHDESIHDTNEEAERIDSDSDLEFEGYFENYYPFPSKIFVVLFYLVYSLHPMVNVHLTHLRYNIIFLNTGCRNLSFVWFIFKKVVV